MYGVKKGIQSLKVTSMPKKDPVRSTVLRKEERASFQGCLGEGFRV